MIQLIKNVHISWRALLCLAIAAFGLGLVVYATSANPTASALYETFSVFSLTAREGRWAGLAEEVTINLRVMTPLVRKR